MSQTKAQLIAGTSTQDVTFNDATVNSLNGGPLAGTRNRIINGDMRIDQRNAGAAVTTSGSFPVDRFVVSHSSDGAFSAQRDTSNPAGFTNSLKITCTTADASLAAGQYLAVIQNVEGFNSSDFDFGQSSAQTVTLSFWTRSSLTGTFGGGIRNSAANRSYPFTYTISSADTWEYKSVSVSGDTAGTWLSDNGIGLRVSWGLGAGTDWSGTAGSWNSNNKLTATGATSLLGTLNATWYVTGVQLEAGTVATPFERRSYGQELSLCQRYFQLGAAYGWGYTPSTGNTRTASAYLPVTMRVNPSITFLTASGLNVSGQTAQFISQNNFGIFTSVSIPGNYFWEGTFSTTAEL